MTSTQSDPRFDRPPVYLEFPDFGYGPASALLGLVTGVTDRYSWHVISTGAAAEFVRRQLPAVAYHDLDTFDPATWPRFLEIAPRGSLVVSCTNPEFAAWAIRRHYRVGVVDTLGWMWPTLPDAIDQAEFHLVQEYFGAPTPRASNRQELIGPIVDPTLWPAVDGATHPGSALIGFGGTHLPGGDDLVAAYVRWFLAAALPVLIEHAGATEVTIVGGRSDLPALIPQPWRDHPATRVRLALDRASYATAARRVEHLVMSPGLTSIYECATGRLSPILQPGFSMSMILQLQAVAATGYPHIAAWPWLAEAAQVVAGLPEAEGVRHVATRIAETIRHSDPGGETVSRALVRYVDRPPDSPTLDLQTDPALPRGAALLATHLGRLA